MSLKVISQHQSFSLILIHIHTLIEITIMGYFYSIFKNVSDKLLILIFGAICLGRLAPLPYVQKKYHKNKRHLCLVTYIFIKLSQNVCLIDAYISCIFMPDVTAIYGTPLDFIAFFWVFSYIIDEYSCLKYCIFTKLSQIMYLIDVHILVCQHAKYDCMLWKVL